MASIFDGLLRGRIWALPPFHCQAGRTLPGLRRADVASATEAGATGRREPSGIAPGRALSPITLTDLAAGSSVLGHQPAVWRQNQTERRGLETDAEQQKNDRDFSPATAGSE